MKVEVKKVFRNEYFPKKVFLLFRFLSSIGLSWVNEILQFLKSEIIDLAWVVWIKSRAKEIVQELRTWFAWDWPQFHPYHHTVPSLDTTIWVPKHLWDGLSNLWHKKTQMTPHPWNLSLNLWASWLRITRSSWASLSLHGMHPKIF